jgi:hypothetical protein
MTDTEYQGQSKAPLTEIYDYIKYDLAALVLVQDLPAQHSEGNRKSLYAPKNATLGKEGGILRHLSRQR